MTVVKNSQIRKIYLMNMIYQYSSQIQTSQVKGAKWKFNGLLRKDGLTKQTDFRLKSEDDIVSVSSYRNNIPRKSLNYKTPLEEFMNLVYSV